MSPKIKLSNLIALAVVAALSGGCVYRISPRTVSLGEVTAKRPPSTIGPKRQEPSRSLSVSFDKRDIRTIRKIGSTVHVEFNDCAGGRLIVDELYVGETPLNRLSSMSKVAFGNFHDQLGDVVIARTYVPETLFADRPELCAWVHGGNMLGQRLTARRIVVKRAGASAAPTAF